MKERLIREIEDNQDETAAIAAAREAIRKGRWDLVGLIGKLMSQGQPLMELTSKIQLELGVNRFEGGLDLRGTGVASLPEGLHVGGSLNLEGTGITELPEGLHVGGYLNLRGTGITSLPEGLYVGGYLNLQWTQIKLLPDDLYVGGTIYKDF